MTALLLSSLLLAACTTPQPVPSFTPNTEPWTPTTPTTSRTPEWSAEGQAAVQAVHDYLHTWADIGQDLKANDWNTIYNVAFSPQVTYDFRLWTQWAEKGYKLQGYGIFTATTVNRGGQDEQGTRYFVTGCEDATNAILVDAGGREVGADTRVPKGISTYVVLRTPEDRYVVTNGEDKEEPC
ncbi:MAG: hypothetical protein LBV06_00595 [Propionibacteriaceae bacterium]|jgi:hypothetical protein|nr:hypothetical protein [Propionibacteriaceae bacterium]